MSTQMEAIVPFSVLHSWTDLVVVITLSCALWMPMIELPVCRGQMLASVEYDERVGARTLLNSIEQDNSVPWPDTRLTAMCKEMDIFWEQTAGR